MCVFFLLRFSIFSPFCEITEKSLKCENICRIKNHPEFPVSDHLELPNLLKARFSNEFVLFRVNNVNETLKCLVYCDKKKNGKKFVENLQLFSSHSYSSDEIQSLPFNVLKSL